jgi:hypothetical protein
MARWSQGWRVLPIALVLTVAGCSDRSVSGTYVAVDEGRTAMLQITEAADRQISGDYSSLVRQPDGTLDIFTSAVTGSVAGRQITLVFRSAIRAGFPQEISGTIDDDALTLTIPDNAGKVGSIVLKRADRSNYEAAAKRLRAASAEIDSARAQVAARTARTKALQALIDLGNGLHDGVERGTKAAQLSLRDLPGIEAQYRTLGKEARQMLISQCQFVAKPDPEAAGAAAEVAKSIDNLGDNEAQLDRMIAHEVQTDLERSSTIAGLVRSLKLACRSEPEKLADVDRQTRNAAAEACSQAGEEEQRWAVVDTSLGAAVSSLQRVQAREKEALETIRSESNAAKAARGACDALK